MTTSKVIQTITGNDVLYKVIKDGYKTVTQTIPVVNSMPTRTEYNLVPSSVVHNPNLNYTVDTSHTYPPVIKFNDNVITPDDTEITTNEYILAPYGRNYVTMDEQGEDNFTRIGGVRVSKDGIVSNFNSINSLFINNLNLRQNDYEIVLEFTLDSFSTSSSYSCFFFTESNAYFNIAVTSEISGNHYIHSNSGNGSTWYTDITGTTPLQLNKTYLVKVIRTSGVRYMYLSEDNGETWSTEGSISDTYDYVSTNYFLGRSPSGSELYYGTIGLGNSYIKVDNSLIWKPSWNKLAPNYYTYGAIPIKNNIATNFASDRFIRILNFQPGSQPWEIRTKIYLTSTSGTQCVFGCNENQYYCPYLCIVDGKFHIYMSGNGSSWNIASNLSSSLTVTTNTWHTLSLIWTGSIYRVVLDGTTHISFSSSTAIARNSYPLCIGRYTNSGSISLPNGRVNLKETYLFYNNQKVWSGETLNCINGAVNGTLVISTDNTTVYNFSSSNYITTNAPYGKSIIIKFRTGSSNSNYKSLTEGRIAITYYNNYIAIWDPVDSVWQNVFQVNTNTTYWMKLVIEGSNTVIYYSMDGINYTRAWSKNINKTNLSFSMIGYSIYTANAFNGTIYLDKWDIFDENENSIWNGIEVCAAQLPGILDPEYLDTGDQTTYNLYDIETNDRHLILNDNRNTNAQNVKFTEYDGQITIPDHGLSVYDPETYEWSKYRIITLDVNNADTTIYTEGDIE